MEETAACTRNKRMPSPHPKGGDAAASVLQDSKRPIVVRYRISERRPVAKSCGYRVQRPIRGSGSNGVSVQRVQSAGPYASADDPGLLLVRESIGEQSGGKLPRASGTDSPTRSPVRSGTPPKGEFGAGSRKRDKANWSSVHDSTGLVGRTETAHEATSEPSSRCANSAWIHGSNWSGPPAKGEHDNSVQSSDRCQRDNWSAYRIQEARAASKRTGCGYDDTSGRTPLVREAVLRSKRDRTGQVLPQKGKDDVFLGRKPKTDQLVRCTRQRSARPPAKSWG